MVNSLNCNEWFDYIETNQLLMTLNEIKDIQPGESLEVLFLDRNFLDFCPTGEDVNIFLNLNKFYRGKFTRHNDNSLKGQFTWYPCGGPNDTTYETTNNFEFHCKEEGTNMYWPFTDDRLNFLADDWRFYQDAGTMEDLRNRVLNECKHYSEINGRSLVGWRGPMIQLDKVSLLPNINTENE